MNVVDLRDVDWGAGLSGPTRGLFPKARVGNIYYKMSAYNKPHKVYGIQSISEVMASRVAAMMGVKAVRYRLVEALVRIDGEEFVTDLCISRDYNTKRESVITFEELYLVDMEESGIGTVDFCKKIGIIDDIYKMFAFDYVIGNLDRHGANIELLVDKDENIKMAPLFDNGMSLFASKAESEIAGAVFNDNSQANNYVGSRNLLENLGLIDCKIGLRRIVKEDRAKLFKGLGDKLSKERRDAIWNSVYRRCNELGKIPYISWQKENRDSE